MAKDYKINEGNMIGAMPAEFDANTNLQQKVLKASADVKKGQVVVISDDMEVAPASAASAAVLGVAMFDAKEGDPVSVETEGLFRLTASGAITAGAQVESAAGGKVATKGDTVTKVIGIALNTTPNGGEVFVKFSI